MNEHDVRQITARMFGSNVAGTEDNPQLLRFHTNVLQVGAISVDERNRIVLIGNRPVDLAPTEFGLLSLFVQNAGCVLTHRFILSSVNSLGAKDGRGERDRVGSAVETLQQKLCPEGRVLFVTVPGAGYLFTGEKGEIARTSWPWSAP